MVFRKKNQVFEGLKQKENEKLFKYEKKKENQEQFEAILQLANQAFDLHPLKKQILEKISQYWFYDSSKDQAIYKLYPRVTCQARDMQNSQMQKLNYLIMTFFHLKNIPVHLLVEGGIGATPIWMHSPLRNLSLGLLNIPEAKNLLKSKNQVTDKDLCLVFQDKTAKTFKVLIKKRGERDNSGLRVSSTTSKHSKDDCSIVKSLKNGETCFLKAVESLDHITLDHISLFYPEQPPINTLYTQEKILEVALEFFKEHSLKTPLMETLKKMLEENFYQDQYQLLNEIVNQFFSKKEIFTQLNFKVLTSFDTPF